MVFVRLALKNGMLFKAPGVVGGSRCCFLKIALPGLQNPQKFCTVSITLSMGPARASAFAGECRVVTCETFVLLALLSRKTRVSGRFMLDLLRNHRAWSCGFAACETFVAFGVVGWSHEKRSASCGVAKCGSSLLGCWGLESATRC